MIRVMTQCFDYRPLFDFNLQQVTYYAKVSFLDTATALQYEETVPFVINATDTGVQAKAALDAAIKAAGEAHGWVMAGVVVFEISFNRTVL